MSPFHPRRLLVRLFFLHVAWFARQCESRFFARLGLWLSGQIDPESERCASAVKPVTGSATLGQRLCLHDGYAAPPNLQMVFHTRQNPDVRGCVPPTVRLVPTVAATVEGCTKGHGCLAAEVPAGYPEGAELPGPHAHSLTTRRFLP